jgi:hypothetical protein
LARSVAEGRATASEKRTRMASRSSVASTQSTEGGTELERAETRARVRWEVPKALETITATWAPASAGSIHGTVTVGLVAPGSGVPFHSHWKAWGGLPAEVARAEREFEGLADVAGHRRGGALDHREARGVDGGEVFAGDGRIAGDRGWLSRPLPGDADSVAVVGFEVDRLEIIAAAGFEVDGGGGGAVGAIGYRAVEPGDHLFPARVVAGAQEELPDVVIAQVEAVRAGDGRVEEGAELADQLVTLVVGGELEAAAVAGSTGPAVQVAGALQECVEGRARFEAIVEAPVDMAVGEDEGGLRLGATGRPSEAAARTFLTRRVYQPGAGRETSRITLSGAPKVAPRTRPSGERS